jgi:membrane associated rhomboid family serine protease
MRLPIRLAGRWASAYLCAPSFSGARVNKSSEPIFNVPTIILVIVGAFVLVWAGEDFLLSDEQDAAVLYYFAFIPARYDDALSPSEVGPAIWTFVTYAFLHGGAVHLATNSIVFLPFGSAVARRFGTLRFIGFFIVTAAAGALLHLVTHQGEALPMIGASAAVSGFMAGAIRFAFQRGGPIAMFRSGDAGPYQVPAASLAAAFRDVRIVVFMAAWLALNVVFGIGAVSMLGVEQSIAWQAHIGGFVAGLLLFSLFDPVPPQSE